MARPKREVTEARKRRERTPFGVLRLKMSLDANTRAYLDKNDLVPRWVNDTGHGQRISNAVSGGYEFISANGVVKVGDEEHEEDTRIKKLVGSHEDGSPMYAYLMAIPREFYEEDQGKKENVNKLVDDAIRGGNPTGVSPLNIDPSKGSTYVKNVDYNP